MIKLLLSGKQLLLFIIVAWSLLAFVSYNVLTVQASTEDQKLKDICKQMDGEWKKGECKFEDGVEMGKKYPKEQYQVDFEHYISEKGLGDYYYEGITDKEDTLCDDEDADTTSIEICKSESKAQDDKRVEKACDKAGLKMEGVYCDTNNENGEEDADRFFTEYYKVEQEEDYLSEENIDKSVALPGENEATETEEEKRFEEREFVAELEDDLVDAKTPEQKEKIQGQLDTAREKFGLDKDKEKIIGYDEEGRQLNVINGDYDEEPKQIEDWSNTVSETEEQEKINAEAQYQQDKYEQLADSSSPNPADYIDQDDNNAEEATEQEEDDNQVNTETEDSSDNTDSSDSQDSSDSEDNSSDDGGDSSDSGDDSSSSDDGGDSGDSSESEE